MPVVCTHVDAFTSKPFTGNPASIIVLDSECGRDINKDDAWMQDVAMEMNLSETSFLQKLDDNRFQLRWFTPTAEVDLCGHATLAAAHNLWERKLASNGCIEFETKSGVLKADKEMIDSQEFIKLNFPEEKAHPVSLTDPDAYKLAEGFGVDHSDIIFVGRNRIDYFAELKPEAFGKIVLNSSVIKEIDCRLVCITALATSASLDKGLTEGYHFVSRGFAPRLGIEEDPVTGSTHCALCPYWSEKLGLGESILNARVASHRGGDLRVSISGGRVNLRGQAISTMSGQLLY